MRAQAWGLVVLLLAVLVIAQFASKGRDKQMTHDINAVRLTWALQLDKLVQNASIHQTAQRLRLVELDLKIEALADYIGALHKAEEVVDAER